jgi:hypothetical protein
MSTNQTQQGGSPAAVAPTGCCPIFDPSTFHEKEIHWSDRPFVREHVHAIFHVPIDMGRQVLKAMRLIDAAHMTSAERLMLSDERSPWRSDIFVNAEGPVPGADMVLVSGTFLTRVYEGPFSDAPKWCADMTSYVAAKGRTLKKIYLGYTTCPACAKAYGKNYVVVLAQVAPEAQS